MQTVIVTGGAGFIGSHLCERLLDSDYAVLAVDNLLTSSERNIAHLLNNHHFRFLKHDVIFPLPDDVRADYLFHLASPASPNHHSNISYHKLAMETMQVNTTGTLELLNFAARQGAKFLFASTSEVYGDPLEHPQKETYNGNVSPVGPRSVYDEAKRFGETLTMYFYREQKVDSRIVRIFNTYGPRMNKEDMRMLPLFISQAMEGQPLTIYGTGRQTRSLCYVDDTVEGIMRLMFTPDTKGQVVNIGSPDEHTVMEYAILVRDMLNPSVGIVQSESLPEHDPLQRRADITKAKHLLDWEPKISLEVGLKRTIAYFREISQS